MLLYFGQLVTLNFERFREELNGFFFGDLMRYYHQIYSISTISIFKYFSQLIDSCNKARMGRNPSTGEPLQIAAYNQPKFKVGQRLKDACNSK